MKEIDALNYIEQIQNLYNTQSATELSYRGILGNFIEGLDSHITAINEPKRIKLGAPDYVIKRGLSIVGYIEAKDVNVSLDQIESSEQVLRYTNGGNPGGLDNLILTNYIEFRFYRLGAKVGQIKLAEVLEGRVRPISFDRSSIEGHLKNFFAYSGPSLKNARQLAEIMAAKTHLLKHFINHTIEGDKSSGNPLFSQYKAFKQTLINELTVEEFSDLYAQTITYGLFAARLHDPTPDTFSREESFRLIPTNFPFLKQLFGFIAGPNLNDEVSWIVDELAEVYRGTDLAALLNDPRASSKSDPVIHFYETFLKSYDRRIKEVRGIWYTPPQVVDFIVRAVDDTIASEFGLDGGLANDSEITIKVDSQQTDLRTSSSRKKASITLPKLQVLDPAAGTGTFLARVVEQIFKKYHGQEGLWNDYVRENLLKRIHGFELMMAPYTMAHVNLELLLGTMGYIPRVGDPRLGVYLTNTLEEGIEGPPELFMTQWLTEESAGASFIKSELPIMVVIGNPPYFGESANKGEYIQRLLDDYKKEPGTLNKLKERNSKWINDDYVKFIRFSESLIERTGSGVMAMITNHGFLDNPTFRGMRWKLLQTFDKIYIVDLHGNQNRGERAPNGSKDENVFDILVGVSIIIGIRTTGPKGKNQLARVFHTDIWGLRAEKYEFLSQKSLTDINWSEINFNKKFYYFRPFDTTGYEEYDNYISVEDLFVKKNSGIITKRDRLTIHRTPEELWNVVRDFEEMPEEELRVKYKLPPDVRDWKVAWAKNDIKQSGPGREFIRQILYRPFDVRYTYYTGKAKGFIGWPYKEFMESVSHPDNSTLITSRLTKGEKFAHVQTTNKPTEVICMSSKTSNNGFLFPLYLYPNDQENLLSRRKHNLSTKHVNELLRNITGSSLSEDSESLGNREIAPKAVFNYILAILNSREYREKFESFLRLDFPRIPPPHSMEELLSLARCGEKIDIIFKADSPQASDFITLFPVSGENQVDKIEFELNKDDRWGNCFINNNQFFGNLPTRIWEMYIGGYQPAQKWLNSRKGTSLSSEEVVLYQSLIVKLARIWEVMDEIEDVSKTFKNAPVLANKI